MESVTFSHKILDGASANYAISVTEGSKCFILVLNREDEKRTIIPCRLSETRFLRRLFISPLNKSRQVFFVEP